MKAVRIIDTGTAGAWNEYVYSNPGSISWHVFEWSEIVGRHFKARFFPLAAYENETMTGVLPLYETGGQFYSVAYAVAGGICADSPAVEQLLLERAIGLAAEMGISRITLKHYGHKTEGDLSCDESFYNRELDMTRPIKEIWNGFDEINRSVIDSMGEGYELEYDSNDLDRYYAMLRHHSRINGMPCDTKEWIADHVGSQLFHIAFLKKNGEYLAATLAKKFKDTVSFPYSCATGRHIDKTRYVYLLYWKLINHFKGEGIRIIHSGRIPETDETNDYRLGWNGTKIKYYYQYFPASTDSTEFGSKRGLKRKIFTAGWRMMPNFIVNSIGPKIISKFP